jgi:hypothetical protein
MRVQRIVKRPNNIVQFLFLLGTKAGVGVDLAGGNTKKLEENTRDWEKTCVNSDLS